METGGIIGTNIEEKEPFSSGSKREFDVYVLEVRKIERNSFPLLQRYFYYYLHISFKALMMPIIDVALIPLELQKLLKTWTGTKHWGQTSLLLLLLLLLFREAVDDLMTGKDSGSGVVRLLRTSIKLGMLMITLSRTGGPQNRTNPMAW